MSRRRIGAAIAAGVMAATGLVALSAGPASAGTTNWPVDAQVKAKGDPFYQGVEIFGNPFQGQERQVFANPGETAIFRLRAHNTKFQRNRIVVFEDDFGGSGLVRVFDGNVDVTDAVFGDGYVKKVEARGSFDLRVKLRPDVDSVGVIFGFASLKFDGGSDFVIAEAGNDLGPT
jgi:hypothetical protein